MHPAIFLQAKKIKAFASNLPPVPLHIFHPILCLLLSTNHSPHISTRKIPQALRFLNLRKQRSPVGIPPIVLKCAWFSCLAFRVAFSAFPFVFLLSQSHGEAEVTPNPKRGNLTDLINSPSDIRNIYFESKRNRYFRSSSIVFWTWSTTEWHLTWTLSTFHQWSSVGRPLTILVSRTWPFSVLSGLRPSSARTPANQTFDIHLSFSSLIIDLKFPQLTFPMNPSVPKNPYPSPNLLFVNDVLSTTFNQVQFFANDATLHRFLCKYQN